MAVLSLSTLLVKVGRWAQAEQVCRTSAEAGEVAGMSALATLLAGRGDATEAELWFRKAADGIPSAMHHLSLLPRARGAVEEAEHWHRKANTTPEADCRHPVDGPARTTPYFG